MSTTNNNDTDNIVTIDDLSEDITLNQTMLIFKVTLAFVESDKDNIDNKPEGLRERLISFVTSHEDREKVPEWGSFCAEAQDFMVRLAEPRNRRVLLGEIARHADCEERSKAREERRVARQERRLADLHELQRCECCYARGCECCYGQR